MYHTITPSSLSTGSPGILKAKNSLRFWRNFMVSCMLLFAAFAPKLSKAQTSLTIGTGTSTSSYYPIYTFYGYNYSQSTYLASEIVAAGATAGTPGFISSISYYATSYYSGFGTLCQDWVVYMGNTSKSTFSGTTDWVPLSGLTKVFDGAAPCTGTGWFKITFPTPFYWDGVSNLVVAVDENTAGYTSTMPWQTTTRTGTRSISYYSDPTNPDPASPPTANTTYAGTPNIKIDYVAATPCSGTTVGGTTVSSATTLCPGTTVTLSTTGSTVGTGLTWQWESAPAAAGPWTAISGATALSLTIAPPSGTTTYYRRQTTCTASSSSAYSTGVAVSVSTSYTPPYTETFESTPAGSNVACAAVSSVWDGAWASYYGYNWTLMGAAYSGYSGTNHTPGGSKYIETGYYVGTYAGYTAEYWFTPGISLTTGKTYRFSYWYRVADYMASYYPAGCQFGMYYNTAQSKTGLVAIKPDLPAEANATYKQTSGDFSVSANGTYYMAVKVDNKGYAYYGGGVFDDLGLIELPACNTATASTFGSGGKTSASPNVMCSLPGTTTLSLTSTPPFSGLSFSWEMAAGSTSGFATPTIVGSTSTVSTTITSGGTYYFRCKVTCAATGLSAYSDTTKVVTTPITPPYIEDFEGSTPGTNVPCASYTYSWGDYYWWTRSGVHPYCSGITNHTPGGSKYLHAGLYLGSVSSGANEYWFTPALALTAAKAYNVSFWFSNAAYSTSYASVGTTIGVRAGTAQSAAAMSIVAGLDTVHYLNAVMTPTYNQLNRGFIAPTTGTYYVGIMVNHASYSYYGMAIDDIGINQMPPCSAKPSAGTATASPSLICSTGSSTIGLVGTSLASDLTFQWEASTTSATSGFTPIAGATSPGYTTPVLTSGPVWYRCVVTCTAIGTPNSDISAPVKVSVGALDMPYTEDFETGTVGVNMPCAAVAGTWSSSINYWYLRAGAYSTSYPGVKNHTPGGNKYIYSGYYNGPYYSTGDQFYWFTPALKMTAGKGYQVGFWFNGAGYSTGTNGLKLGIYAGTTQSAAGMTIRAGGVDSVVDATKDSYQQMVRSFVAPTTGNYYVGIKTVHMGYNYPGIPLDDINIDQLPDCSGKPTAGMADASPDVICTSGTTIVRLSGTSIASGITYKWFESTTGPTGTFTASTLGSGFLSGNYTTPTLTTSRWYKCVVTCSISGLTDTSSVVAVNVGAITPPYLETFEKVTPGTNAPCASYSSTWGASSATTYWTTKGFDYTGYAVVHKNHTPGGSNYLWAGYYFGYSPAAGATWFTPAIKLVKDSTYQFSFWYMGPAYYYYNSGVQMGMAYGTSQTEAAMTNIIRPDFIDKRSSHKQLIGRFKAVATGNYYMGIKIKHTYTTYSYYGTAIDDIALDQLPACNGTPTAGTIFATPDQLCSAATVSLDMDYSNVTNASGLTYTWESSTTGATSGFTALSTALSIPNYTTPSLSTTTWFRCVVKCTNSGLSVTSDPIKVDVGVVQPPYFQTFEGVNQGSNAPCASNTSTFSASSILYWGVYRVPAPSISYAPYIDNHTAGGTAYLMAGYYLGTYGLGADQYWFTPGIALTGGKMYHFSYWYRGSGYSGGKTNLGAAYGTSNTAAAMTTVIGTPLVDVNASSYKKYAGTFIPSGSGTYYIGIKVNHTVYSYPGIAIDDIGLQEVPPCSAPVVAGTITSDPVHVCAVGGTTTLDLDGSTLATGLTYQWLSSSSPMGPFTATGGTTVPYATDPLVTPTYFKCIVRCTASGAIDSTPVYKVGVGGKDLPYVEDFESTPPGTKPLCSEATDWGTYYYDAWNVYAGTYTGSYTNHTPGGNKHLIAGYYLGYSTYTPTYPTVTDDNFWFTPGLNMRAGYKYKLSFWYLATHPSYPTGNRMGVFYGKSQSVGGMTGTIAPFIVRTTTSYVQLDTDFTVPSTGVYYIGFKKSNSTTMGTSAGLSAYGVAFDDINLNYAPCAGRPDAGIISSSQPSGTALCKGTPIQLVDIGATIGLVPGIKYQWQRKPIGGSGPFIWKNVVGATDTVLSSDSLVGYEYRLAVVCSNTNDTALSPSFMVPQIPPHPAVTINPTTTPVTYCLGDSVKFTATNFTGAVYDWMIDSVVIPGWKFSDMGATEPGTYMVRVSSALSPCPGWSNKVKLIANDPGYSVTITKPADSIICAGNSMTLTAAPSKPGLTYQWRKNNIDIPGAVGANYVVTTGGYYRVMAYDGTSTCKAASRNINIIVKPNPPAVITIPGGTATACENEGVQLNANTGGFSYEWTRGGSTIFGWVDSTQVIKNTGVYAVKVRSVDGCVSVSSSVTVNILPSPTPLITKSGLVLSTTGVYTSYQWVRNGADMASATSSSLNLTMNGIYQIRVKDGNGCEGLSNPIEVMENGLSISSVGVQTDQIKIYPNPTESKVYIQSPVSVLVSVKDVTGKTIYEARETKEVDLSKYADGVYLFSISDKEGTELMKQQRVTKLSKK
jgi:hypothetical protein